MEPTTLCRDKSLLVVAAPVTVTVAAAAAAAAVIVVAVAAAGATFAAVVPSGKARGERVVWTRVGTGVSATMCVENTH